MSARQKLTRAYVFMSVAFTTMLIVSVLLYQVKSLLNIDFLPHGGWHTLKACMAEQVDAVMHDDLGLSVDRPDYLQDGPDIINE